MSEVEKGRLEKRLRTSEDAGRTLSLRVARLEIELSDRDAALRRIESAYNMQLYVERRKKRNLLRDRYIDSTVVALQKRTDRPPGTSDPAESRRWMEQQSVADCRERRVGAACDSSIPFVPVE